MDLCKPAHLILLVSIAGALYHMIVGEFRTVMWWIGVGVIGTAVFQGLCYGGLEQMSWILMFLPVLVVCFFFAVALLASSMRIKNVYNGPCRPDRDGPCHKPKPRCNRTRCDKCDGCGCRACIKIKRCEEPVYWVPASAEVNGPGKPFATSGASG